MWRSAPSGAFTPGRASFTALDEPFSLFFFIDLATVFFFATAFPFSGQSSQRPSCGLAPSRAPARPRPKALVPPSSPPCSQQARSFLAVFRIDQLGVLVKPGRLVDGS